MTLNIKISHDWPRWASVEAKGTGAEREDGRTTTLTAVPGQGTSWNVFAGYSGWGCDNGLRTDYSDTEGPVCCSPLSIAECDQLVRALDALVDFLMSGADVPSDPDAWPPVVVLDYDQAPAAGQEPGGPAAGLPGIPEPRERPARPPAPPGPQKSPGGPPVAPGSPTPDKEQ